MIGFAVAVALAYLGLLMIDAFHVQFCSWEELQQDYTACGMSCTDDPR